MRLIVSLISLFSDLPWWASLVVIAVLIAGVYLAMKWVQWKFDKIVHETIIGVGSALKDAQVTLHSVIAVAAPERASPYDCSEDDENFAEGLDGEPWEADDADFYLIDATITPAIPMAVWDPTALTVVLADFAPDDETDACIKIGGLHSAQLFENGRFVPATEEMVVGPQRVKMLFGIPNGVREVKLASMVTYFGEIRLPTPLPKKVAAGR
jgi:hypothetical protein